MALTIVDKPFQITPVNQKLMVVLYDSANNSNAGFKYSITVTRVSDSVVVYEGLIDQNSNGYGVIDLRPILAPLVETSNYNDDGVVVHKNDDNQQDMMLAFIIDVGDGWDISGTYTPSEEYETWTGYFWNGSFNLSQGYKPNPESIYRLNRLDNSATKQILSDRRPNISNRYQIPNAESIDIIRPCSSSDYGVLSLVGAMDSGTGFDVFSGTNDYIKGNIDLFDATHAVLYSVELLVIRPASELPWIYHYGLFPANVQNWGGGFPDDWKYYSVQFFDENDADPERPYPIKPKHWFYREECEVRFDKVRLGWLNSHGGWDYFNFTKRNEQTTEVERKRIKAIQGDYSTAGGAFTMDVTYGEQREVTVNARLFMDVNTSWIDEYDFQFLSSLIRSKRVHIVGTDGSITPVVVESNSWLHKKSRNATLSKGTIKLQLANGWQQM